MAVMELWRRRDLEGTVKTEYVDGNFFTQDSVGNLVGVKCYKDGAEDTLSGSVTGYCILTNGETVSVAGTRSGNKASILIPQSALAYPGPLGVVIKLVDGNTITTLISVIVVVYRSKTDTVITPSSQIITDWSNQIAAALQEVEDASAAQDAKIDDLKSALLSHQYISGSNLFNKNASDNTDGSYINSAGNISSGSTSYGLSGFIPVTAGQKYTYKSRQGGVCNNWYSIDKEKISSWDISSSHPVTATAPDDAYYIRVTYGLTEKSATQLNESDTLLPYEDYEDNAVSKELRKLVAIDPDEIPTILMLDSKVDKLITSKNLFNKNADGVIADKYLNSSGNQASSTTYGISDYIPVVPGKTYCYSSRSGGAYCWFYNSNKQIPAVSTTYGFDCNTMPKVVTAPAGVAYIRLSFGSAEVGTTIFAEGSTVPAYEPYENIDSVAQIKKVYYGDMDLAGQSAGLLGANGVIQKSDSLSANSILSITNFPIYLKKNTAVSFSGKFSSFSSLLIGKGNGSYRGDWVEITSSQIKFHHYESSDAVIGSPVNHGLTIANYLMVMLYLDENGKLTCTINTMDGTFTTYRQTDFNVFCGDTFAKPAANMTNVVLSVSNGDTQKPFWFIGDSYCGVTADRVFGQLKALGFWDGFLGDGIAGLGSANAYAELNKLLQFGKPKYLVWYLGMNDTDSNYLTYMNNVKSLCESNHITLILNKVPTVPARSKETIGGYVTGSGCRYIDSYAAVGTDSSGNWYDGMLEASQTPANRVHPTVLGAKALAMRILIDVPEIMEYGFNQTAVSGESQNDH